MLQGMYIISELQSCRNSIWCKCNLSVERDSPYHNVLVCLSHMCLPNVTDLVAGTAQKSVKLHNIVNTACAVPYVMYD